MEATELRKVGRPLLFDSAEKLDHAIAEAINKLVKAEKPLIVENIALELDCSPSTLRKYGERVEDRPEFLQPIKKMLDVCQAYQVSKLFNRDVQVAGVIFALKNNYPDQYKDKFENENVNQNTNLDLPATNLSEDDAKRLVDDYVSQLKRTTT